MLSKVFADEFHLSVTPKTALEQIVSSILFSLASITGKAFTLDYEIFLAMKGWFY